MPRMSVDQCRLFKGALREFLLERKSTSWRSVRDFAKKFEESSFSKASHSTMNSVLYSLSNKVNLNPVLAEVLEDFLISEGYIYNTEMNIIEELKEDDSIIANDVLINKWKGIFKQNGEIVSSIRRYNKISGEIFSSDKGNIIIQLRTDSGIKPILFEFIIEPVTKSIFRMDYYQEDNDKVRYGTSYLKLDKDRGRMRGSYAGYGPGTDGIISGDVCLKMI